MTLRRTVLLAAMFSVAPTALVLAQTSPSTDQTSPSSASSPHQRDTTKSNASEAAPTEGSNPADASSPHQRQATSHSDKMKECVAKQQTSNSGMSAADARKACKAQLKGPG